MTAEPSQQADDALGKIDVCNVPAIIKWTDSQRSGTVMGMGTSLSSTPVSLDINFDATTSIASFRLRIALLQRNSDKPMPLFLLINPSSIQSLASYSPEQSLPPPPLPPLPPPPPESAPRSDDHAVVCLRFQLSSPPILVMPPEPLRLKDKSQTTLMRLVRWAARQTNLSVHIHQHILPAQHLGAICEAPYSRYKSSPRHTDIGRLYGGRGGNVLDVGADSALTENSPPSYDDVPAPPPMAPVSYGMSNQSSCPSLCVIPVARSV